MPKPKNWKKILPTKRGNELMISKSLSIADHKRIMYWFHLAYKRKKPTNEDTKTIAKIHARMILEQEKVKKEWYKK